MTNETLIERVKVNLVLIGCSSVGKTAIIHSLLGHEFNVEQAPTIGTDFIDIIESIDDKSLAIRCFDTSGKEAFLQITKNYLTHANIVLVVVDISKGDMLPDFEYFKKLSLSIPNSAQIVLCLNKTDLLIDEKEINKEEPATLFEQASSSSLAGVIITSAKSGIGFQTDLSIKSEEDLTLALTDSSLKSGKDFQEKPSLKKMILNLIIDLIDNKKITTGSSDSELQPRTNLCSLDCCFQKRGSKVVRTIFTILYLLGAASSFVAYILFKIWNLQALTAYLTHHTILSKLIALHNVPILTTILLVLFFNVFFSLLWRRNVNLMQDIAISFIPIIAPVVIKIVEKVQKNQHHKLPDLFKNDLF